MSRFYLSPLSYVGTSLAFAALTFTSMSLPVVAQTSASKNSTTSARVQHVVVRGSGDSTEVEIQTSGSSVAPDAQTLTGPDRIIVDFPGALPAADLHALELKVNSGALKGIRTGLFFNNPPITRIVLDLSQAQSYHISTIQDAIVLKLGPPRVDSAKLGSSKIVPLEDSAKTVPVKIIPTKVVPEKIVPATAAEARTPAAHAARLQNASLASGTHVAAARVSNAITTPRVAIVPPPPPPLVSVSFVNGMLSIRAEKATLAQVLYEVQQQTHAEIAIPSGAEQELVISDLGPAPARDVLASLLNGSPYNFIFVGSESTLQQVILTRRDPSEF
jgi:hypothetical protein